MIRRFYADNFRCLVNFELELDELNVFLGANGTGKSSVFDVLRNIQRLVYRGRRIDEVFRRRDLSHLYAGNQPKDAGDHEAGAVRQKIELDLQIAGHSYHYRLSVGHRDPRKMRIDEEILLCNEKPLFEFRIGEAQLYRDDGSQGPKYPFDWTQSGLAALHERHDNRKLSRFKRELAMWTIVRPCPPIFEEEATTEDELLTPAMTNFVAWYRRVSPERLGAAVDLLGDLRDALPSFESLSLIPTGEEARALRAEFKRHDKRSRYRLGQLSDGQRALIALYCLLRFCDGGAEKASLFVDEPDNYISLREVQPWVVALSEALGDTLEQAVIISHHPVTIDYLGGEAKWFFRDDDGLARVKYEPPPSAGPASYSEVVARGWER